MQENLTKRKNIRLKNYDYSRAGMYFITILRIIQQFKWGVTRKIGYSIWQKLFYEHIVRNEKEYLNIREYI